MGGANIFFFFLPVSTGKEAEGPLLVVKLHHHAGVGEALRPQLGEEYSEVLLERS